MFLLWPKDHDSFSVVTLNCAWQAAADVGVSIYTGTEVAIAAAAIVLMQDSLLHLVTAIDLARATCRRIRFNLLFSLSYNLIGIPMSAGVLYPWLHIQVGACCRCFVLRTVVSMPSSFPGPTNTCWILHGLLIGDRRVLVASFEAVQAPDWGTEGAYRQGAQSANFLCMASSRVLRSCCVPGTRTQGWLVTLVSFTKGSPRWPRGGDGDVQVRQRAHCIDLLLRAAQMAFPTLRVTQGGRADLSGAYKRRRRLRVRLLAFCAANLRLLLSDSGHLLLGSLCQLPHTPRSLKHSGKLALLESPDRPTRRRHWHQARLSTPNPRRPPGHASAQFPDLDEVGLSVPRIAMDVTSITETSTVSCASECPSLCS